MSVVVGFLLIGVLIVLYFFPISAFLVFLALGLFAIGWDIYGSLLVLKSNYPSNYSLCYSAANGRKLIDFVFYLLICVWITLGIFPCLLILLVRFSGMGGLIGSTNR